MLLTAPLAISNSMILCVNLCCRSDFLCIHSQVCVLIVVSWWREVMC